MQKTPLYQLFLRLIMLWIQNAEDTVVSIILAFNNFEITHNGACVLTCRQDSYLTSTQIESMSHLG